MFLIDSSSILKRDIILLDDNGYTIRLTFWGELTKNFNEILLQEPKIEEERKKIGIKFVNVKQCKAHILAVSNMKIGEYGG